MVKQPARRGDQNVGAPIKLSVLLGERHPANQQSDGQFVVFAIGFQRLGHLGGQLAGWFHHQGAGHAGPRPAALQMGQHRQGKGCGLAGAGLRDAQDVPALQRRRDRTKLNFCWFGISRSFYRGENLRAQPEVSKCHAML